MARNGARIWILASAVGCFAAGMSAGLVLPSVVAACAAPSDADPDEEYVRKLSADLGLTGSQQQGLRVVMQRFHDERLAILERAHPDQLAPALQAEVTAARRRQKDRIDALLTAEQRRNFDEKVRAIGSGK